VDLARLHSITQGYIHKLVLLHHIFTFKIWRDHYALKALDMELSLRGPPSFQEEFDLITKEYFPDFSFTRDDLLLELSERAKDPEQFEDITTQLLQAQDGFALGIVHGHAWADELFEVLVLRANEHFNGLTINLPTQTGDHIVGFVALLSQHGYMQKLGQLPDTINLTGQFIGHGWAVGLVISIEFGPEGGTFGVEYHR